MDRCHHLHASLLQAGTYSGEARLEGVPFSYRCGNLICKHGEKLFLIVVFEIFVGVWAPTIYNVALPLGIY